MGNPGKLDKQFATAYNLTWLVFTLQLDTNKTEISHLIPLLLSFARACVSHLPLSPTPNDLFWTPPPGSPPGEKPKRRRRKLAGGNKGGRQQAGGGEREERGRDGGETPEQRNEELGLARGAGKGRTEEGVQRHLGAGQGARWSDCPA